MSSLTDAFNITVILKDVYAFPRSKGIRNFFFGHTFYTEHKVVEENRE